MPIFTCEKRKQEMEVTDSRLATRLSSLLNHTESTDVTFLVGSKQEAVLAHKCVLAASSECFHKMLFGPMKEATSNTVSLGDERLSAAAFRSFLCFVYTGITQVTRDTVFEMQDLARQYDFPDLEKACKNFLANSLTPENCLHFLAGARMWNQEGNSVLARG
jgi:hypothetical protein